MQENRNFFASLGKCIVYLNKEEAVFCKHRLICATGLKFEIEVAFNNAQKISALFIFKVTIPVQKEVNLRSLQCLVIYCAFT